MTYKWTIRSIKHWDDGTWDALLRVDNSNGWNGYDRVISKDGFHWVGKRGWKVDLDVQAMLTEAIGDMLELGATTVIF